MGTVKRPRAVNGTPPAAAATSDAAVEPRPSGGPLRLTSLRVKNFRCIADETFELGPLAVLVGKNNVGKSTILTAIQRLFEGSSKDFSARDFHADALPIEFEGTLTGITTVLGLSEEKHRAKIQACVTDGDAIRIRRTSTSGYNKLEIWQPDKNEFGTPTGIDAGLKQVLPEVIFVELFVDPAAQAEGRDTAAFGKILKVIMEDMRADTDAEMRAGLAKVNALLNVVVGEDGRPIDNRTPQLRQIEANLTAALADAFDGSAARIRVDLPELPQVLTRARVELHDGDKWTDAELKGQGQQRALYVALLRTLAQHRRLAAPDQVKRPLIILLEEPEAFLHPTAHATLRGCLEMLSTSGQVVYTTHAPSMVAPKHVGETTLVRKRQSEEGRLATIRLRPLREALEGRDKRVRRLFEYPRSSKFLFANTVLVVEGQSDIEILEAMLFRLAQQSFDDLGYACIDSNDKTKVRECMDILQCWGLTAFGVVDLDFLWRGAQSLLSQEACYGAFSRSFWDRCRQEGLAEDGKDNKLTEKGKAAATELVRNELANLAAPVRAALQKDKGIWCLAVGELEAYAGLSKSSKGEYSAAAAEIRSGSREIQNLDEIKEMLAWMGMPLG